MRVFSGLKMKLHAWRVITILGCIVFTASIFYPFLQSAWLDPSWEKEGYTIYWSFREVMTDSMSSESGIRQDFTFAYCWTQEQIFGTVPPLFPWFGPITLLMFETQVLTVSASCLAVIKEKRYTIILPTLFAATTLLLMILAHEATSYYSGKTFQTGFWLTAISLTLFSTNAISLALKKLPKQT